MNTVAIAKRREVYWIRQRGRWRLELIWKKGDAYMGRFGGGWNWSVGFQLGNSAFILNCLVFMVIIRRFR